MRRLRQSRVLIIAAYREVELDRKHPLADALVQWNSQRLAVRIQLTRLSLDETNKMISTLFWQESVSDAFARVIHRETDGNPFFVEEVIKALVEQGQIYWLDDHWERDELEKLAVPQSIKEAIGRRLNSLTEDCVEMLHTAAVIGKDFSYSLLAAVSTKDEDQLLDALDEATTAQLIRQLSGELFIFTHDKIREVLYDEILGIRRSRLHLQIAKSLELSMNGELAAQVEDLAYHFIAAGVLDKGMEYAIRSAKKAQQLFAGDEALGFLREAYECAQTLGSTADQANILEMTGDVYSTTGPLPAAVEKYNDAIKLAPEHRAQLWVKIGLVLNTTNDEKGISVLEDALTELDPDDHPVLVAEALAALGRFHHYRCEYSAAIELYEQARRLAEPLDDPQALMFIYAYTAAAYQHLAQLEQSNTWADITIKHGHKHGYLPAVAAGYEFIAENHLITGRWNKALEAAEQNRHYGEKIGSSARVCWSRWITGEALWGQGELLRALPELEQSMELAIAIGEKRLAILCNCIMAVTHADLGHDIALEYAAKALEESHQMVERFQQGYAMFINGYANLQLGNFDQASDAFLNSAKMLGDTESRDVALYRLPYQAEAVLALGDVTTAAELNGEGLELARNIGAPHYEAVSSRVRGQILAAQERFDEAEESFDKAISLLAEPGSRVELGRCYYQKALAAAGSGRADRALEYARQAETLFVDCHASLELERSLALLAQLS
jgi:tetratricopeptide (TPR) repeat protein